MSGTDLNREMQQGSGKQIHICSRIGYGDSTSAFGWAVSIVVLLLMIFSAVKPVSAFYPPLRDVEAWVEGGTVRYKIYDPQLGSWQERSWDQPWGSSDPISNLTSEDGVVAWSVGYNVHYRVYDPGRGSWQEGSYAPSIIGDPPPSVSAVINKDGVVAWAWEHRVYYRVYDPERESGVF